jgi:hypothetical protein
MIAVKHPRHERVGRLVVAHWQQVLSWGRPSVIMPLALTKSSLLLG